MNKSTWLRPSQAAEILNVHQETVRRYAAEGLIQSKRTKGNHRRYLQRDVNLLKTQQTRGQADKQSVKHLSDQELTAFFYVLYLTMRSGVSFLKALPLACSATENPALEDLESVFQAAIVEKISQGDSLANALASTNRFPKLALVLVEAGEESGELVQSLQGVSEYYSNT